MNAERGQQEVPGRDLIERVLEGPHYTALEQQWRVRLKDGQEVIVAQLLPELARDELVRRRYVADVRAMAGARCRSMAATLETCLEGQGLPWRLREQPRGDTLETWLARHSPASVKEVQRTGIELAGALAELHRIGVLVLDLDPAHIVSTDAGPVFAQVGLSRVQSLSSRTAASLVVAFSPYAAPEHQRGGAVDVRSDLYGLGVLLWQALTGQLPFPKDAFAPRKTPALASSRAGVPEPIARLIERCLGERREDRPFSADEVLEVLRRDGGELAVVTMGAEVVSCQACGAELPNDQRLCMRCGKLAVQLVPVPHGRGYGLLLEGAIPHADAHACLLDTLQGLGWRASAGDMGDGRGADALTVDAGELPTLLVEGLCEADAERLAARLYARQVAVSIRDPHGRVRAPRAAPGMAIIVDHRYRWIIPAAFALLGVFLLTVAASQASLVSTIVYGFLGLSTFVGCVRFYRERVISSAPLVQLRGVPMALPASDPLVSRLAALLVEDVADDVRNHVATLGFLVQRVVDHRAALLDDGEKAELVPRPFGAELVPRPFGAELELLTAPLLPLVEQLEAIVHELLAVDAQLRTFDEVAILRGLDSARALAAPFEHREPLLVALDRLHDLRASRTRTFGRLLDASHLLRRAATLALDMEDPEREQRMLVEQARQALEA